MDENPYRSPPQLTAGESPIYAMRTTIRKHATGICIFNTCVSCLVVLILLLVPATPYTRTKDLVMGSLIWWHLLGHPAFVLAVIWSLSGRGISFREYLRLKVWCGVLLIPWFALVVLVVLVVISEAEWFS